MKKFKLFSSIPMSIIIFSLCCFSCVSQKKMIYLQNDGEVTPVELKETYELVVQPDDQLAISISSKHKELVAPFNTQTLIGSGGGSEVTNSSSSMTQSGLAYFQVDEAGFIDFPILGRQQVKGMTCREIAASLMQQLQSGNHIKDAQVTVKLMSFKVTVLGEVSKPGMQQVSSERLTILEALGYAGDLLPSAQRKNVKVLREEHGVVKTYFVDLTSTEDVMQSPVYYLQQNDVVYVQPNKSIGAKGSATLTTVGTFSGILSMLVSIVSIVIATTK